MEISTDTATICVFDKACLRHRINDVGDWWSLPNNEMQEVAAGNVLFLNLGDDGCYSVNVIYDDFETNHKYNIIVKSGFLFLGPGAEVSGGGFEPDGSWGGGFIELSPGNYVCKIRKEGRRIDIFLSPGGNGVNVVSGLIEI